MKCCKQKDNLNKAHSHPAWMMLVCCGIPILLSMVISLMGISSFKLATAGAISFLCPIMMTFMMLIMVWKNKRSELCQVRQRKEILNDKTNSQGINF